MRLAWFSPLAPVPSGIATYTAIILPRLATRHEIDVFVDTDVWAVGGPAQAPPARDADGYLTVTSYGCHIRSAHDFVPKHSVRPYDLVVYQLGNARCHDYQWPYLLRHPGLVVLHDAQLHQSRAAALLQQKRPEDYRGEFAFSHHDAPEHVTDWVISGLGNAAAGLYPLTGLVLETARSVAVHHPRLATSLLDEHATVAIGTIRLGTPDLLEAGLKPGVTGEAGTALSGAAPGFSPANSPVLFAAFGLITPEKRIPQILRALAAIRAVAPASRLRLVGAMVPHYDVQQEITALGLDDIVEITGYVDDRAFDQHVRDADVCLCLRWPTNREASRPWYQCLSAGKATVTIDLVHLIDVPTLDPRTWTLLAAASTADAATAPLGPDAAVAVSLDILDEDHSLVLAMRRLALDAELRSSVGRAARRLWTEAHTLEHMTTDYERALADAAARPSPAAPAGLPMHAREDGTRALRRLAGDLGVAVDLLG